MATPISAANPNSATHVPIQPDHSLYLENVKKKVCEIVQSRWTIIAAASLAIGLATNFTFGAIALTVGAVGNWYFAPVSSTEKLRCLTMNTIGVLSDFLEFMGNYGPTLGPIKERTAERLLGAVAGKQSGEPGKPVRTEQDIVMDCNRGGTFGELLPDELLTAVIEMAKRNGIREEEFEPLKHLIKHHKDERSFNALQNCSPDALTGVDNDFRKAAKAAKKEFDLPTVNSPAPIVGDNYAQRVFHLARVLFTKEKMSQVAPVEDVGGKDGIQTKLKKEQKKFPEDFRTDKGAIELKEIAAFADSPIKAATYFFLYECSRLFEISQDNRPVQVLDERGYRMEFTDLVAAINAGKEIFKRELGNPLNRAQIFERHITKNKDQMPDVIFVQECESNFPAVMAKHGYVSTDKFIDAQGKEVTRSKDGSVILLNTKTFEPKFEVLPYENDDLDHKSTAIVAMQRKGQIPTVLFSTHGDAKDTKRTLTLITRVINTFKSRLAQNPKTQCVGGVDANPNNPGELAQIKAGVATQGFAFTDFGVNMAKGREITSQVRKRRDLVIMQKDGFVMPQAYQVTEPTTAFEAPPLNPNRRLPDAQNPSDHAAQGAVIQPVYA